jgi:hypothetical protein
MTEVPGLDPQPTLKHANINKQNIKTLTNFTENPSKHGAVQKLQEQDKYERIHFWVKRFSSLTPYFETNGTGLRPLPAEIDVFFSSIWRLVPSVSQRQQFLDRLPPAD